MLWILLLILFIILLVYLLFLPIDIVINTEEKVYSVRLGVLARLRILGDTDKILRVQLKTLFMRFNLFPVQWRFDKKKKKRRSGKQKKKRLPEFRTIRNFISSFQVKTFAADIDTGNCITNARCFPVFAFFNFYFGTNLGVNFQGRNRFVLHLHNRPIYILRSFINPKKLYHGITL